jgi:hypothetical protein
LVCLREPQNDANAIIPKTTDAALVSSRFFPPLHDAFDLNDLTLDFTEKPRML